MSAFVLQPAQITWTDQQGWVHTPYPETPLVGAEQIAMGLGGLGACACQAERSNFYPALGAVDPGAVVGESMGRSVGHAAAGVLFAGTILVIAGAATWWAVKGSRQ